MHNNLMRTHVRVNSHAWQKMSILNYFRRTSIPADNEDMLDPNGSLSKEVFSSAIAKANALVSSEIEKRFSKEWGPYLMLMPAQKFEIGCQASEHGVTW